MGAIIAARAIQVLANFVWVSAINVPFYQPVAICTRELAHTFPVSDADLYV